jgi:hypothetical protein
MLLDPIWFECVVAIGAITPIIMALYLAFTPSSANRNLGPKYYGATPNGASIDALGRGLAPAGVQARE